MLQLAQNEYFNPFLKTTPFCPLGVKHVGRYGEIFKYSFLSRLISEDEILSDASSYLFIFPDYAKTQIFII
jgi:hypothetical protein